MFPSNIRLKLNHFFSAKIYNTIVVRMLVSFNLLSYDFGPNFHDLTPAREGGAKRKFLVFVIRFNSLVFYLF